MIKFDGNDLAIETCRIEGKKEEQSIAQVKETIRACGMALVNQAQGDIIEAAALFTTIVLERCAKDYKSAKN